MTRPLPRRTAPRPKTGGLAGAKTGGITGAKTATIGAKAVSKPGTKQSTGAAIKGERKEMKRTPVPALVATDAERKRRRSSARGTALSDAGDYYMGVTDTSDAESVHLPGARSDDDAYAEYYAYTSGASDAEDIPAASGTDDSEDTDDTMEREHFAQSGGKSSPSKGRRAQRDSDVLVDELAAEVSFFLPGSDSESGEEHQAMGNVDANLVEHLAKMTPQILAAISVAARSLGRRGGARDDTMTVEIETPTHPEGATVTLSLEDVMDTKKLAKILSTSPMPSTASLPPCAAVPLAAYRRSRRGSFTAPDAGALSALRQPAVANCTLLQSSAMFSPRTGAPRESGGEYTALLIVESSASDASSECDAWSSDDDVFGVFAYSDDIAAAVASRSAVPAAVSPRRPRRL